MSEGRTSEGLRSEGFIAEGPVEARVLAPATRFIFRGGAVARRAAGAAFGVALPETPCRASAADQRAALWLGPDEHLLLAPAADREADNPAAADPGILAAELDAALTGIAHSLVDVSQRHVAMRVSGSRAVALLNTGCPLDLSDARFPVGMCTRTLLGKAEVVLWRTDAVEFHLEAMRSFQDYVLEWLREAGRSEFLLTPETPTPSAPARRVQS